MKFSAAVQLQYLLHKYRINPRKLQTEMSQYYQAPNWQVQQTAHGRVTGVILTGVRTPVTVAKSRTKPKKSSTQISYRRRRQY